METFEEFAEKIKESLEDFFMTDKKVRISKVKKNNGVILCGITILGENTNISPTIYLEEYYENYRTKKQSIGEIVMDIIRINDMHGDSVSVNMDFFTDYENVKDKIAFKLVNTEKNTELLKEIPSVPYLDMSIIFYYIMESEVFGDASILIYHNHIKMWNVTVEELYEAALVNTPLLLPAKIKSMEEVMRDIIKEDILQHCDNYMEQFGVSVDEIPEYQNKEDWITPVTDKMLGQIFEEKNACPMYVLTNQKKLFGAACMTYQGVLKEFAGKVNDNFFVLPSSVHEVILIPDGNFESPKRLEDMVKEVNESQVTREEVLTDSVYFYCKDTEILAKI